MALAFRFNDGGRSRYFRKANVGDCSVRAAAIASGRDYKEVYNLCRKIIGHSPRNGVSSRECYKIMAALGATWHPCMGIGTGCKVHLVADELPIGRIVCRVTRHVTAVIDRVINDTYDCTRGGRRCVYGYWKFND